MNHNDNNQRVIEEYQHDEKMMILIYAQWCINHDLDPQALYREAYPEQPDNKALTEALQQTVVKEEADEIANDLVLNVLQLFGNDDLAFVVQQEIQKRKK